MMASGPKKINHAVTLIGWGYCRTEVRAEANDWLT